MAVDGYFCTRLKPHPGGCLLAPLAVDDKISKLVAKAGQNFSNPCQPTLNSRKRDLSLASLDVLRVLCAYWEKKRVIPCPQSTIGTTLYLALQLGGSRWNVHFVIKSSMHGKMGLMKRSRKTHCSWIHFHWRWRSGLRA